MKKEDENNITYQDEEVERLTWEQIWFNLKKCCPFSIDFFFTQRLKLYLNSKGWENVEVELLVDLRKAFINVPWNRKVDKHIKTTQGEVVKETEKVNTKREWGCYWRDHVGGFDRQSQWFIDDLIGSLLTITKFYVEKELWISWLPFRRNIFLRNINLSDDICMARKDIVVVVHIWVNSRDQG